MVSEAQPPREQVKESPLVKRILEEVEANLKNEQFGVEKLADNLGMSRSQLHRKLKQVTGKSANQYIREYRLNRAMQLLQTQDISVSEVASAVGFGSASYFSACFAEFFGYPPGEVRKRAGESAESPVEDVVDTPVKRTRMSRLAFAGNVILALALLLVVYVRLFKGQAERRKSTTAGSLAFFTAVIYTALGDKESALHWLNEAYNSHEMEIPWLISEPQLKPLHDEPGFRKLVALVKFPINR